MADLVDRVTSAATARNRLNFAANKRSSEVKDWCCQTGLNCRPLHYQWSALPLSYGSMPRIRESAQKDLYRAGRSLPQAPRRRKRGWGLTGPQKLSKSPRDSRCGLQWACWGPIRFPICSPGPRKSLTGRVMTSNSIISSVVLNVTRSIRRRCQLPVWRKIPARPRGAGLFSGACACDAPFIRTGPR